MFFNKLIYVHVYIQTDRQTDRHTDRQTDRHTDRQDVYLVCLSGCMCACLYACMCNLGLPKCLSFRLKIPNAFLSGSRCHMFSIRTFLSIRCMSDVGATLVLACSSSQIELGSMRHTKPYLIMLNRNLLHLTMLLRLLEKLRIQLMLQLGCSLSSSMNSEAHMLSWLPF